jgi:hypothetical protein
MKKTEPTNVIATVNQVVKRGMARPAVIGALVLLVSLSVILVGGATSRTEQQAHGTAQSGTVDWKAVEQAVGRPGAMQPGYVYRFSMPRSDLRVTVGGVEVKPALALGSWAAFKMIGRQAMVMGDLVMTEDEVSPVMARL